jgi:NAD(P)-dependent dehydrogenase (short-subunit alcohol dehydrogenase family)
MSTPHLIGKVIVITGSTRGLGLAIAQACSAAGAAVVVSSRHGDAVAATVDAICAAGGLAAGAACDVGNLSQVVGLRDLALTRFGRLDAWVNNAGDAGVYGPTLAVPVGAFENIFRTNMLGTYYGSIIALQHFVDQRRGKLINVLGAGDRGVRPLQNAYGTSKVWVGSFTRTLAKEYRNSGAEIIAFNPGLVITELLSEVAVVPGYEQAVQPLKTVVQLWGNPPSVPAQRVVWLVSSATDGRNGLVERQLNGVAMLRGLLREGWRRFTGTPAPAFELNVHAVKAQE